MTRDKLSDNQWERLSKVENEVNKEVKRGSSPQANSLISLTWVRDKPCKSVGARCNIFFIPRIVMVGISPRLGKN